MCFEETVSTNKFDSDQKSPMKLFLKFCCINNELLLLNRTDLIKFTQWAS